MDEWRELFEKWRRIVAEVDPEIGEPALWEEEPPGYFLHAFRPNGRGIERLFESISDAAPALERLERIFQVAGPETGHPYFIPNRARRDTRTDGELVALANDYFDRLAALARDALDPSDDDDAFLLASARSISAMRGLPPDRDPNDYTSLEGRVYEIVTEWAAPDHWLSIPLGEPLYMLACSYELRNWALWQLDSDEQRRSLDPFDPWFCIWSAGGSLHYGQGETGENHVLVVAPRT